MHGWRTGLVGGAAGGAIAAVAFLVLHAILIVPIWRNAPSGIAMSVLFGAIIGVALAWTMPRANIAQIALFLWGAIAIPSFVQRVFGEPPDALEVAVPVAVAALYGLAVGVLLRRTIAGVLAAIVASVVMLVAAVGPVPLTTPRGLQLFLGMLIIVGLFATTYRACHTFFASSSTPDRESASGPATTPHVSDSPTPSSSIGCR